MDVMVEHSSGAMVMLTRLPTPAKASTTTPPADAGCSIRRRRIANCTYTSSNDTRIASNPWLKIHTHSPGRHARPCPCAATNEASTATAPARTLYDLLGVPPGALLTDIKAAYRSLAALYHPDVNPTNLAAEKFQAIVLAYEVLQNEELRRRYDQHGLLALGPNYARLQEHLAAGTWQGVVGIGKCGKDLYTVAGLEFREAITGTERVVSVRAQGQCQDCKVDVMLRPNGTGASQSGAVEHCEVCHGSGEILRSRWRSAGPCRLQLGVCPACGGKGCASVRYCARCGGEGRSQMLRHVRIRVPAGVQDGQVLRVRRQGDAGRFGGHAGDLFVKLQVYDLDSVERRGDDLHSDLVVNAFDAVLGASVPVTTVRGERLLTIPPGTQHGSQLCLPSAGVATTKGGSVSYGHHYFQVKVSIPVLDPDTSAQQVQDLLQQLAAMIRNQSEDSYRRLFSEAFDLGGDR